MAARVALPTLPPSASRLLPDGIRGSALTVRLCARVRSSALAVRCGLCAWAEAQDTVPVDAAEAPNPPRMRDRGQPVDTAGREGMACSGDWARSGVLACRGDGTRSGDGTRCGDEALDGEEIRNSGEA
mmetsp:Transcript_112814/g.313933  ORF Transcript_112814/g.313933 Transcript_112814/m.313933 type:complete len:128 (+) Transcript_112814:838-1221(+)